MTLQQHSIFITAPRQGLHEFTDDVAAWLVAQPIRTGLLTVFIRHTSASLMVQENVSPDVLHDMETFFDRLVPEDEALYRHIEEGPDDMPAHIKGAMTQSHLQIPVANRQMLLGRYQGLFLFEQRREPRRREIVLHLAGQ